MKEKCERRDILRFFYALVVVIVGSAVMFVVVVFAQDLLAKRSRDRMERYNLRTQVLARETLEATSYLELVFMSGRETAEYSNAMVRSRAIALRRAAIEDSLNAIVSIQSTYRGEQFAETVQRVDRRYDRIAWPADTEDWSTAQLRGQIGSLRLALRQLAIQHSIATEKALDDISTAAARQARNMILTAITVFIVAGGSLAQLLRRLRHRLDVHDETRNALRERERQLQHSQKLEAVGTLVGGVTHDFNNMLAAIQTSAEVLGSDLATGSVQESCVDSIQSSVKRAAALTRQLLMFTRQNVGEPRIVDLNVVVRRIELMLRSLIPKSVALVIDLEDAPAVVKIDPVHVDQVLINLAVNARDAMPNGGQLSIRTRSEQVGSKQATELGVAAGDFSVISVEDDGSGMTSETLQRAFDPFYTTKQVGKGTGLGLSTVHGIAAANGGAVSVESQISVGTTFHVFLPRTDAPMEEPDAGGSVSETSRGSETILLVEDDDEVRKMTSAALLSVGYDVLSAADGAEALSICREHEGPIHLILTDVVMPGLRGHEVVERVRALFPHICVVFMSGYADEDILQHVSTREHSMVFKPFTVHQLTAVIRRELESTHSPDGVPESTELSTAHVRSTGVH